MVTKHEVVYCSECGSEMKKKSEFQARNKDWITIYQCSKCKTVDVDQPIHPPGIGLHDW